MSMTDDEKRAWDVMREVEHGGGGAPAPACQRCAELERALLGHGMDKHQLQTRVQELEAWLRENGVSAGKHARMFAQMEEDRDRLRAQLATAREALEFYADETRWKYAAYRGHSSSANEDQGDRARAALAALDAGKEPGNG